MHNQFPKQAFAEPVALLLASVVEQGRRAGREPTLLALAERLWRTLSFVNTLVFLVEGRYRSLLDRLICATLARQNPDAPLSRQDWFHEKYSKKKTF